MYRKSLLLVVRCSVFSDAPNQAARTMNTEQNALRATDSASLPSINL